MADNNVKNHQKWSQYIHFSLYLVRLQYVLWVCVNVCVAFEYLSSGISQPNSIYLHCPMKGKALLLFIRYWPTRVNRLGVNCTQCVFRIADSWMIISVCVWRRVWSLCYDFLSIYLFLDWNHTLFFRCNMYSERYVLKPEKCLRCGNCCNCKQISIIVD